ncbi:hypothetical protein EBR66_00440 [bacterium]|nr:hypothetical protein [bacterium]
MKRGARPKGTVNKNWSPGLAYVVGLITSDGCLSKNGRHIDITSKDYSQVKLSKKILNVSVKIGKKNAGANNEAYRIQLGDVLFYRFLLNIGITPSKSKTIQNVRVPKKYFSHFLRGYFDGDGTTSSYYDSKFHKSFRFYLSFMSASPQFIFWLRNKINLLVGVEGHLSGYSDRNYLQLRYAKNEACVVARYMYKNKDDLFLPRKFIKIQKTLKIIENSLVSGRGSSVKHSEKCRHIFLPPDHDFASRSTERVPAKSFSSPRAQKI